VRFKLHTVEINESHYSIFTPRAVVLIIVFLVVLQITEYKQGIVKLSEYCISY